MMLLNTVSFPFADEYYSLILFLVIITLALTIILKSTKIFITQLILLLTFFLISESSAFIVGILFIAAQILLSLTTLYQLKKAIDRNYMLVLEKNFKPGPIIQGQITDHSVLSIDRKLSQCLGTFDIFV